VRSVSSIGFQVGNLVVSHTPRRLRYGAARLFGDIAFYTGGGTRRQALENYAGILQQPEGSADVHRIARESMVGYAKLLADFMTLPSLTPEQIDAMVDWEGFENIEAAMAQARGAIVVTPHFGNWDLAAAAAVRRGLPLTAVTEHFGDDALNQKVVEARQRFGMKVVSLSVSAGKEVLRPLHRGEVVALVCDLPPATGRTVVVRVCGQQAIVPAGPAVLALRTGAPVVPILCRRLPDNRYRLTVQPPIEYSGNAARDGDVQALAQAIMDRFEPDLMATPEQWYLFSPMWGKAGAASSASDRDSDPAPPQTVGSKAGAR
jgi:lauroyl/myristoyl acyltransferase